MSKLQQKKKTNVNCILQRVDDSDNYKLCKVTLADFHILSDWEWTLTKQQEAKFSQPQQEQIQIRWVELH